MTSAYAAATPVKKGAGGSLDDKSMNRLNVEMSSLKKKLEAMEEDLKDKERSRLEMRTQMEDALANAQKFEDQSKSLQQEVESCQKELEAVQRKAAEDEKKQQKARAQAQKTTKEAYKFVKEIGDLSRRNEELEEEITEARERLASLEGNSGSLADELAEVRSVLETTERDKEERDRECEQLRNKVAELTLHDEELEEERELLLARVTKEIQDVKRELETKTKDLDDRERELNEATTTVARLEKEKKESEVQRRIAEFEAQITELLEEKTSVLDQYIQMQQENKTLKDQVAKVGENEKKTIKRLQILSKAKENEVRATFFEKQEEMADAERRNTQMSQSMAEMQDQVMELEQHISQLENGTFGLPEAMKQVQDQKRELESVQNRVSARTKELNDAFRKVEDLHEEVKVLRAHVKQFDPSFKITAQKIGFASVAAGEADAELEWGGDGMKPGFRLDISAYKVKTAMELEKAKAVTLQLEREVEALEVERLEMKTQLRHLSLQRGERAAKIGMSAVDIEKLDAFAEQLKSGGGGAPTADSGPSAGDKIKMRKMQERLDKTENALKDSQKELRVAIETIEKQKEDIRNREQLRETIQDLRRLQGNFATGLQQNAMAQLEQAAAAGGGAAGADGTGVGGRPAVPVPMAMGLGGNVIEQLARAMRDGELGDQASVDVAVSSCRNLPVASTYVAVDLSRGGEPQRTSTQPGLSPSFNETLTVPVPSRNNDTLFFRVYKQAGGSPDPAADTLVGRAEVTVADFGRAEDKTWSGSKVYALELLNEEGEALGQGRSKPVVELRCTFVEAPRKRAEDLERQLESIKGLQSVTKERLAARERETELLREDLARKTQDLDHAVAERNRLRDEVQRTRFNSGFGGAAPAPLVVAAPADGLDAGKAQDMAAAYRKQQQELGDLNAYLIQALDDLSKREEELSAAGGELARYKEDLGVLRVQQVLLYKEHTGKVAGLEQEVAKLVKQWNDEKHRADLEASKASNALERLASLSQLVQGGGQPEVARVQRELVEAERKIILLQADHDMSDRVAQVRKEEEHELRTRYDALVLDMTRQEQRLKQRIGQLDRSKLAAETRLSECQRTLANSVPKEELGKLRQEYLVLKEKHSTMMNRDSKALLERASAEGFKQKAERLATEQQEMRLQLSEATDRAAALAARLEQLALREGPPEQQQLATLSEKLVRLEVSERNAARRAELSMERMRSYERDVQRLQERVAALEEENVESVARVHDLEARDRELRARTEGSVSSEQAREMRARLSEMEAEIAELKISSSKFQEVADLATDQAKAMEELHTMQLNELEAMRAYVSQVQSQGDDQAEIGMLHRRILDRERQVHELTGKVTSLDKELVRMDEYVVRLEDTLERKSEQLFKVTDESGTELKRLERTIEDLKASAAGQIPLEKADQWAASLRDLTEQKQSAAEDLSVARKKAEEADERAETLQVQLDDARALLKTLREEPARGAGGAGVERLSGQAEEMTRLKLENLRLARQSRQLQEREAHLEQTVQAADAEARRLEERLVSLQQDKEAAQADAGPAKEVAALRARVRELEAAALTLPSPPPGKLAGAGRAALEVERAPSLAPVSAAEARGMDYQAIVAMRDEVARLTALLESKDEEVEALKDRLDSAVASGAQVARAAGGAGLDDAEGLNEAAQHTQEVARLAIERLEKNNKRKNEMITKYQEQLRQSREEYMAQKELDNETIEQLREQLSKKTQEAIQGMRARAQPAAGAFGGLLAERADAALAEKDQVIAALNSELQALKRKTEELLKEKQDVEVVAQEAREAAEKGKDALARSDAKRPSQVLETLVFKLKKQLKEKEKKQEDMKAAIEGLRKEMLAAADAQAAAQVAAMTASAEGPVASDAAIAEQAEKLKKMVEDLEAKLKKGGQARAALSKEKEELQGKLEELEKKKGEAEKRLTTDLRKAQAEAKKAQEKLKRSEEAADDTAKQLSSLEKRVRDAEAKAAEGSKAAARRGVEVAAVAGTDGREEATRRWEAEKRLEQKVERLTSKLREHKKEMEALEKRAGDDKARAEREADALRQRVELLEEDKRNLKARVRGAGGQMDSEEVLARVREAEARVKALEEENERVRQQLDVEARQTANELRTKVSLLERRLQEARDDKDRADELRRAAEGGAAAAAADARQAEIRRLESEVARLRSKEEGLEADLLAAHNQLVRPPPPPPSY